MRASKWSVTCSLVVAVGLVSCTQDFDQFQFDEPAGAGPSTSVGSGSGGSTSTSSGTTQASTTTASTGTTGGGTGSTGGAGGSSPEDCTDGADNDGDALTDCADPDCGAFECVPEVPAGWQGYYHVNTTPFPEAAPASCPDGSAPATFFHDPQGASCEACACGGWAGAACDPPPISCWEGSATCQGAGEIDFTAQVASGACFDVPDIPGTNTPRSCAMTGPALVADPGACPASGGALVSSQPWASQDDVCTQSPGSGSGCGGQQACVPAGTGAYAGPACIRKVGINACPPEWPTTVEIYSGETDDRGCTACSCAVSGTSCAGASIAVHEFDGCTGPVATLTGVACTDVSSLLDSNTGAILATLPQPAGGACQPGGGQPTGGVQPMGPMTLCCL